MSLTLAQINLGTAPAGKDGDTQRTANSKTNDNMTAIASAVNDLSTSVQANTTAIATKAAQTSVDALQARADNRVGEIVYFARNTAPTGWLKSNGAAVSRTTYAALFAKIGTTFGAGDGSTTFNLPDLRGEFPRGWDDGRGVDAGRAFGSFQDHQVQDHAHPSGTANSGLVVQPGSAYGLVVTGATGNPSSGNHGAETRPRNVALLACINFGG